MRHDLKEKDMLVNPKDLLCLQIQLRATKEELQRAIAAVGTDCDEIEQYLQRQKKPHLVEILHSNIAVYPG